MAYRSPFYLIMLTVLLAAVYGCGQSASKGRQGQGGGAQRGSGRTNISVQTATLQRIAVQRQVDLSGTLISPDQAKVSSEVAGIVRDVLVEIGQEVTAGQELVRLDETELNLALQRAESALRQTEVQLGMDSSRPNQPSNDDNIAAIRTAAANRDDARAQMARAQELVSKGLLSKAELDTTETRVKVTEAAYQAAVENVQALRASLQDRRASFELAKKKVEDAVIRAPLAGSISERLVQRGEFIRENTPVVTIVRMNPLKLRTAVQEKHANLIHQNQTVDFRVEPYPKDMFHGKIAFISPAIEQGTRTFIAEILVDNPARKLKPGFFAQGQILVSRDEGVLGVPEQTVSTLAGVSSVFVIENGVVKQQTVQLGEHEDKFFEVVSGLKGNEILAASNLNELVSGMRLGDGGGEETGPAGADPAAGTGERRGGKGRRGGGEGKGNGQ
ncbi:MAG TPA: efflux RND transporter periplasmic adaptor subunit [Terriglobia bacterium]|nr:efflux RND transporter periplasmic adaptor subunit [Terriglobia bacterium]